MSARVFASGARFPGLGRHASTRGMRVLPLAFAFVPLALSSACPPAGDDDDDVTPPVLVSLGGVTLFQGVDNHTVSARFGEPAPLADGCTSEELAGCTLLTCAGAGDPVACLFESGVQRLGGLHPIPLFEPGEFLAEPLGR